MLLAEEVADRKTGERAMKKGLFALRMAEDPMGSIPFYLYVRSASIMADMEDMEAMNGERSIS